MKSSQCMESALRALPLFGFVLRWSALLAVSMSSLSVLQAQLSYTTPYTFSHLAGSIAGPGIADGTGAAAQFSVPQGVASDSAGNVYVADTGNHTIRKITPSGVVTTFAGSPGESGSADGTGSAARFNAPHGVAVDSAGSVYVADTNDNTIRKITPTGDVSTLAGTAIQSNSGSADGIGSSARFSFPQDVAVDSAGNVYVADTNSHTIRKITPAGMVSTLAGTAGQIGGADGIGTAALFNYPTKVTVDGAGNVYVADTFNNTIRKITPVGVVTTLAGTADTVGSTDDTGAAARFNRPSGVSVDTGGNVYVSDQNNHTIRKITPAGVVSTLAGLAGQLGDLDGSGAAARFAFPVGIMVGDEGNIYVADGNNSAIREITPTGDVTTFAGPTNESGSTDGTGSVARFAQPKGVAMDLTGNVYVADTGNHTIRKITPTGVVTTFAGLAGESGSVDGTGSLARFDQPVGVAVDTSGNVYVADSNDTIRKITPAGVVTTLAGMAGVLGFTDGTGSAARFGTPTGVAVDSAGNVYVSDYWSAIRKITPAGVVTTIAGTDASFGFTDGTGSAAQFNVPLGLAVDTADNLYVADAGNHAIRKITSAGVVTTLAGALDYFNLFRDGTGTDARFAEPMGVAVDSGGNVYVTDSNTIRKITPFGVVTTLAGTGQVSGNTDGTGAAVQFQLPEGIAVDGAGNIYVADARNNAIRKGSFVTFAPLITTQPTSQTLALGNSVTFTSVASGVPTPTYQWKKGGVDIIGATGATYSIANIASSDAGNYTVVVTNSVSSATSNPATLTVVAPPVITTQPLSQAVIVGNSVIFTAAASGIPTPTFQWKKGGVAIGGATDTTYSIANIVNGDAGSYTVVATNSVGSATSNSAILTVVAPPVITMQPLSQTIVVGSPVSFTAAASGVPTPTLQWKKGGVAISGATGGTYAIANVATGDAGNYTVVATNSVGSATSGGATLTVNSSTVAPMITTQPLSQVIGVGKPVTFFATAVGMPSPTLQWRKGGVPIIGATGNTYMLTNVAYGEAGSYTVVATNAGGSATSDPAILSIDPAPVAPVITTQPLSQTLVVGASVTFTAAISGTPVPTVQWKKNGVNILGAITKTYTIDHVTVGDAGDYTIVAINVAGSTTSSTAILTVNEAPVFTVQPKSQSSGVGLTIAFTAVATGVPEPTYQWQKNGVPISGAVGNYYAIPTPTAASAGSYAVVATNSVGTVTSSEAVLTIVPRVPLAAGAATGDFDHDGQSDLFWQNTVTGERSFWLMNGTGFKQGVSLGTFAPDWTIVGSGDFNGDGQEDLLWQNTITGERTIWLMNGTSFSLGVDIGTYSTDIRIMGSGDFNEDGQTDILVANTLTGETTVWVMNGTTKTSEASLGTVPTAWSIAGTGDFNGDGKVDLIWQNAATGERSVWLMDGTTLSSAISLGIVAKQFQIVGTGDYNGDGKTDLVWTDTATGDRTIWLMNGLVHTGTATLSHVSPEWSLDRPIFLTAQTAHADFDLDGNTDMVVQNSATGERTISFMNGSSITSTVSLGALPTDWVLVGTGDFNQDDSPDLVWTNTVTGERQVWLMDGITPLNQVTLTTISPVWEISAVGDFNYDGKPDLVWSNTITGERSIWLMNGTVFGTGVSLGTIPPAWKIATTADMNGDGRTDLIWQNTATGESSVWLMNGGVFTTGVVLDPLPLEWTIVGTGDFNADHKADLLLQNTATGERAVRLMNRTALQSGISLGIYGTELSVRN